MNIFPIQYINKQNLYSPRQISKANPMFCGDNFERQKAQQVFSKIRSYTLNELYNTNFLLQGNNVDKKCFPTFVFDKETRKPVEVIVSPAEILASPPEINSEEYHIYEKQSANNLNPNKIGRIYMNYNPDAKSIETESMATFGNKAYDGLGIRLHQIAIERMLAKGYEKYVLMSVPEACDFHKRCGFEPLKDERKYDFNGFMMLLTMYAERLSIDKDKVKSMMIYKQLPDNSYSIELNGTFENFINYGKKVKNAQCSNFCIDMQLSDAALKDWKTLIRKSPIFQYKNLPKIKV